MTDTSTVGSGTSGDLKGTAQEQAQQVAGTTKQEASQVVDTAKEQVQAVTSDIRDQTRQLTGEARTQLMEQAGSQRDRAVESLRSMGEELTQMAESAEGSGLGVQLAHEAGSMTTKAAKFLEDREPAELVDELRGLARRRPGAFLLGAAAAGLVAGRLTRGVKSAHSSDSSSSESSGTANNAYATSATYVPPTTPATAESDTWGPDASAYPASSPSATTFGAEPGGTL